VELEGDGIVLRSWRAEDAPAIVAELQDEELLRWLPRIPRPYTLEHAQAFLADQHGDGPHQFAVEEDGRVVGSISVRMKEPGTGDIGYWCARDARGRGITTRALRRICRYALDELGLQRLQLTADPENFASQRVAEKVGFQREGVLRSHLLHQDGTRRDSISFSLLPGELR
jgi:RimJ/RimL family protein N-acetyltransferase